MLGTIKLPVRHLTTKMLLILSNEAIRKLEFEKFFSIGFSATAISYFNSGNLNLLDISLDADFLKENKLIIKNSYFDIIPITVEDYLFYATCILYIYEIIADRGLPPFPIQEIVGAYLEKEEEIRKVIRKTKRRPLFVDTACQQIMITLKEFGVYFNPTKNLFMDVKNVDLDRPLSDYIKM